MDDPFFQAYWKENFGKRDELLDGARDLAKGNADLSAALEELEEALGGTDYPLLSSFLTRESRDDLHELSDGVKELADGSAELHKIYLLPEWWGRGVGAWLLAELCRRAKEAGATCVWLRVNKRNVRAQKAYRAAGFANVRALCTDIGGGFVMDDFVFERRLGT